MSKGEFDLLLIYFDLFVKSFSLGKMYALSSSLSQLMDPGSQARSLGTVWKSIENI